MSQPSADDLLTAASHGDVDVVRALLAAGVDPASTGDEGGTALHRAARQGHVAVVRLLLEAGADVDAVDGYGNTPLWRASFGNNVVPSLVEMLLAAGADADVPNNAGRSPRDLVRTFRQPGLVALFDLQ